MNQVTDAAFSEIPLDGTMDLPELGEKFEPHFWHC